MKLRLTLLSLLVAGQALLQTANATSASFTSNHSPSAGTQTVVQGWRQSNISGFGDFQSDWVSALGVYDGHLYAGVRNNPTGGQVWRTADGQNWVAVNSNGFGDMNVGPTAFAVFSDTLFVGTGSSVTGAGIYSTTSGLNWTNVITGGFGITESLTLMNMTVFSGHLYAATVNDGLTPVGAQIWRTPDGLNWTNVVTDNFGLGAGNNAWMSFEIFNGQLYAGTGGDNGGVLYRTSNGTSWTVVTNNGFGDANNTAIPCLASFNGYLYACMRTVTGIGAQVWRSNTGNPGTWAQVVTGGFGNPDFSRPYGLIVADNMLFLTLTVRQSLIGSAGDQVWRTTDGTTWAQDVSNGWGDPTNSFSNYSDKSAAVFNGGLYVGTVNTVTGGQIWQRLKQTYLPLVTKN
jgi:hypothetical protein